MINILQKFSLSKRQALFYTSLLILTFVNIIPITRFTYNTFKIRHLIHINFDGYKFSGLNEIFGDAQIVGYFTDIDLTDSKALKQFSQAQYMLAPIILDSNDLTQDFVIFNCSTEDIAMTKIQELNLKPIKKNNFGIIIAKRK